MELLIGERRLRLVRGDITHVPADVIVNAANSQLATGGGVDGAIHRAAGPSLRKELDRIAATQGGCPPGSAVVTRAGDLAAKYVFHAVGPVYRQGAVGQDEVLASCYRVCLNLAEERGMRIIAFPAISAGAYAYPLEEAAEVAVRTVVTHLQASAGSLQTAIFALFEQTTYDVFGRVVQKRIDRLASGGPRSR